MFYAVLKIIHLLCVIVWVGGMVFAQFFLRPALLTLAPPQRVRLMQEVLGRFFQAVLFAGALAVLSGAGMIDRVARQTRAADVHFNMPLEWMLMALLGALMLFIFAGIRFVLYPRLKRAVQSADWATGADCLVQIRRWVSVNLVLALAIVVVTLAGVSS